MPSLKKSMVIKLFAGLGNQLFQYTYGQYLASIGHNVLFLQQPSNGDFSKVFKTDSLTLGSCKYIRTENKILLFSYKVLYKFIKHNYYTGYYQEKKYSEGLFLKLPKIVSFLHEEQYRKTSEYKRLASCESVSLHIRGGDYLQGSQYTNICTSEYYKNAIEYILKNVTKAHFFVFTNDVEYAQSVLTIPLSSINDTGFDNTITFISNKEFENDPGFDLFLISQCKHNIIANSTYSWWGAFLNENTDKIVVCPTKWTNEELDVIDNFALDDWIRIG